MVPGQDDIMDMWKYDMIRVLAQKLVLANLI